MNAQKNIKQILLNSPGDRGLIATAERLQSITDELRAIQRHLLDRLSTYNEPVPLGSIDRMGYLLSQLADIEGKPYAPPRTKQPIHLEEIGI